MSDPRQIPRISRPISFNILQLTTFVDGASVYILTEKETDACGAIVVEPAPGSPVQGARFPKNGAGAQVVTAGDLDAALAGIITAFQHERRDAAARRN